MPKRIGRIKSKFLTFENFDKAERKARKNKKNTYGVRLFLKDRGNKLNELIAKLESGEFRSTPPRVEARKTEYGKVRNITILPYYPDRILAHAILRQVKERITTALIENTFNSIEGRGIHSLNQKLKRKLHGNPEGTKYCLKIDIRKFYESVDTENMLEVLSRYVKDEWFMGIVREVLENTGGLSIGGLLSQLFSNILVSELDHLIHEELKVRYYFRYADDMVLLFSEKEHLHYAMYRIRNFIWYKHTLELNSHRQVFEVSERGIDYVGYVFHHSHTRIRNRVKKSFIKKRHNPKSVASYKGMLKYCDSKHLIYNVLQLNNHASKRTDSRKQVC